jgi:hypothetical protein
MIAPNEESEAVDNSPQEFVRAVQRRHHDQIREQMR